MLWRTWIVSGDINVTWEDILKKFKISAEESLVQYEEKEHKPNFVEECSKFVDERKLAKLQWLQDPSPTVQKI